MKLRNKKTEEIGTPRVNYQELYVDTENGYTYNYKSLQKMCEEWEDVPEEPKEWYWYIEDNGVIQSSCHYEDLHPTLDKARKEIGNYFETKEEAEKAVEKLKAWKRLKDKGLYFTRDVVNEGEYEHNFVLRPMMNKDKRYVSLHNAKEIYNDIKLIFDLNIKEVKNE